MKKMLINLLVICLVIMNSGCFATVRCVQKYNDRVDKKALELRMAQKENGETSGEIAIDLLQAADLSKGYWAAWKNNPGSMTAALGIDTLWMSAAGLGGKAIYDAIDDDGSSDDGKININLENSTGNSINIVYGDNNDSNNDDNQSAIGDSNFDEDK